MAAVRFGGPDRTAWVKYRAGGPLCYLGVQRGLSCAWRVLGIRSVINLSGVRGNFRVSRIWSDRVFSCGYVHPYAPAWGMVVTLWREASGSARDAVPPRTEWDGIGRAIGSSESLLIVNTRTRGMEMTTSAETGVEGQSSEADDQLATQPVLPTYTDPTQAPVLDPSKTNGSGPMQPHDGGAVSPHEKKPPQA